nr:MAG TPA: hypothetical protein [Caudoviricetes sp.]
MMYSMADMFCDVDVFQFRIFLFIFFAEVSDKFSYSVFCFFCWRLRICICQVNTQIISFKIRCYEPVEFCFRPTGVSFLESIICFLNIWTSDSVTP